MDRRRRKGERPGAGPQQEAGRPAPRRKSLLNQYHRIAHDLFATGSTVHLPDSLVAAIKSGQCGKLASLLKQPSGQRLLNAHHPLTGDTPLIIAARSGNKEAVSILLSKGADATLENESGESALDVAAPDTKRFIMDAISTCDTTSDQTLLNAAWLGDSVKVKQCLNGDQYIDVNCTSHGGMTPLLLVTKDISLFEKVHNTIQREYNPVEAMKELLEKHADVTASDKQGRSALHLVASDSSVHARRMVSLLLTHGSDVETVDSNVCTPLHHAAESGNIAIVIALVEEGRADINKASGERGDTPLITTARHGHSQQARYLLSHGADVTAVNDDGDTALSVAATTSMVHLLKEAWPEATEAKDQGPPLMAPAPQCLLSSEPAVLEELEKSVGECESEAKCDTPASLESTPLRETDSVFFDEGDGHSRHPKAFITEFDPASPFSSVVRSLSDPSLATKVQQQVHKDSSLQDLAEAGLEKRSNSVKNETRPLFGAAAGLRQPAGEGEGPRPRSRAKSMAEGDIERPGLLQRRQPRSSLRHVAEEKGLQSIAGDGLCVRKNSEEKKLRRSLESVAVTGSSSVNGATQQRLPQLETGAVTAARPGRARSGVRTTPNNKLPSLPKNAMPLAMVAVEMDKEVMYVHKYGNGDPTPHPLDSSSTSGLGNTPAKIMKKAKSQSAMQSEAQALSRQQCASSKRRRFSDAMVGLQGVAILPSEGGAKEAIALPQLQRVAPCSKGKDSRPLPPHEKRVLAKGQAAPSSNLSTAQHLSSVTEAPESRSTPLPSGGENPAATRSELLATPPQLHSPSPALSSSSELSRTTSTIICHAFSADSLEPSSDDTLRASSQSGEDPAFDKENTENTPPSKQEQPSTIPVLPEVSKTTGVTYLVPPPPVKVGNIVINTPGPLEGNSPLSPIWFLQRQLSSDAGSSSPESYILSNLGRHTPVQHLRAPEPPNICPRQDSGQGESDSDKQSYDESDDSTDNQVIDTDVDQILRWKKGKLLGKGAYGRVWEGLTDSTRMIAVKEVELDSDCQEKAESQFEKLQVEVGILRSLCHRNIVGYLGACMNNGMVYIFMEYISGGSIQNILKRFGPLSERSVCSYTKQILKALHYLHYNRIIHRDIKGANIMVTPKGMVKLIDFGCAKKFMQQLDRSIAMHSVRGTPYWMAPEIILGHKYGPKSDIWSLGATVHEMATTKPPWGTLVPEAAMFQIGIGKSFPSLPQEVSESLNDFYRKCLMRDPSQRPSSEQLLDHHFFTQFQVKKKRSASNKPHPLK